MAEKLGEAVLELRTVGSEFNAGVDKAEGRAKQLGATLDMTAGSALELADKMAQAGREGGQSAAVWQRAAASIDMLAAAQAQSKTEIGNAKAAMDAGKSSLEDYNRTLLLSKAALAQVEEEHRQAQAELKQMISTTHAATGASGQQRAGLQQLGYQLGDISTMYALGMKPAQIFASQVGQVTGAVQMLAGEGSKFASFLSGPWGIAVMIGVQALGPLIAKLFETADAADGATSALDRLAKKRQDALTERRTLIDAEKELNGLLDRQQKLQDEIARRGVRNPKTGDLQFVYKQQEELKAVNADIAKARADIDRERGIRATGMSPDQFDDPMGLLKGGNQRERKERTGRKGANGKTEEQIEAQYLQALVSLNQEELQARLALATSASERADIAYQMLADQREQREREIRANKDYSEAQKKKLLAELDVLYGKRSEDGTILVSGGLLKDRIARDQIEAEKRLDAEMLSRQQQTLEAWARVAGTSRDRAALELQALQLQQQIERNLLEQQIATGQIADAAQARALLESRQAAEREGQRQANAGPLERYTDQLRRNKLETGERVEELMVQELDYVHQSISDSIADRLGVKDPFLRGLIDMFIEDVFIRPMAEALQQASRNGAGGGGGGGFFSSLVSSLFSSGGGGSSLASLASSASATISDPAYAGLFANGGEIPAGSWGIAGEAGPEPVFASRSGAVVMPNSSMGSGGGRGGQTVLQFDLRGAVMTEDLLQQMSQIAQETTANGFAQYDPIVAERVKEHLERRG
jgi:hypothetical protein